MDKRPGIKCFSILLIAIFSLFAGCASIDRKAGAVKGINNPVVVLDPYQGVDWQSFQQYKANLHTHTTESDGEVSPSKVIDKYHSYGYTVLALTDHNVCTYPWERFGRSPSSLGMLAIPGQEHSCWHHTVSLFCEYVPEQYSDLDYVLKGVAEHNGLAILSHPGEYWIPDFISHSVPDDILKKYTEIFTKHTPYLLGMEVFNAGYRWRFDSMLWDAVLTEMMPHRPVWGFANEDMHFLRQMGRDWNIFIVPALTVKDVRESMEKGRFYFSTLGTYQQGKKDVEGTPVIHSIVHDSERGTITIHATERGEPLVEGNYRWISGGVVVHTGSVLNYKKTEKIINYIRAELTGSGGITFTNPFGFSESAVSK